MSTTSAGTALFGQTRQRVLALFLGTPDRAMHVREAVRAVGSGSGPVQRELATLAGAGLLLRERLGNQVRYRANPTHPVFPELRSLIMKTVGLVEPLRTALERLSERIAVAFVFGSVAKGQERAESDVDLLVIGDDLSLGEVVHALRPAQEMLAREVTPVVYSLAEVRARMKAGHAFLEQILAEPKLFVIGGDRDVARMAGERVAGAKGSDPRPHRPAARRGRAKPARRGGPGRES